MEAQSLKGKRLAFPLTKAIVSARRRAEEERAKGAGAVHGEAGNSETEVASE